MSKIRHDVDLAHYLARRLKQGDCAWIVARCAVKATLKRGNESTIKRAMELSLEVSRRGLAPAAASLILWRFINRAFADKMPA